MIDRAKVIKGLEWIIDLFSNYERHAMGDEEMQSLNDAIVLLKAQEPVLVKPYTEIEYGFKPKVKVGKCPNCGRIINEQCNYCSKCGRAVKWDD